MTVNEACRSVVLLNCLDPVYGHSILKLLNAQREIAREEGVGCIVLVPTSLSPLVPDGTAEIWQVSEPVSRLEGWLLELEERVALELGRFERCLLSPAYPHPHPSTYDLEALVDRITPERLGDPSVVLALRDDRLWGSKARAQADNVARFSEVL